MALKEIKLALQPGPRTIYHELRREAIYNTLKSMTAGTDTPLHFYRKGKGGQDRGQQAGCLFPRILTYIVHRKFVESQEILVNIFKSHRIL